MVLSLMLLLYWRDQILQKRKSRLWTSLIKAFLLPRKAAAEKVPNKMLPTWEALKIPAIEKEWIQFFKYSVFFELWNFAVCTQRKSMIGTELSTEPENNWELRKSLLCLWMSLGSAEFTSQQKGLKLPWESRCAAECTVNISRNISLDLGTCLE